MSSPAGCSPPDMQNLCNQMINLAYYCGSEKILSHPQFQHCGGERPRGSGAFENITPTRINYDIYVAVTRPAKMA